MTAICGGGASQRKAASPLQVFATGMAAQSAIEALFGVTTVWSAAAVFVASQVLDLTTFCTTDPPAVPTFSASDITDILLGFAALNTAGYAKLVQLCQVALWHVYCECATGSASIPSEPTYPTAPHVSNPGDGPVPFPTTPNCDGVTWFEGFGFNAGGDFTSNGPWVNTVMVNNISSATITISGGVTAGAPYPVTFTYTWKNHAAGTTLLTTQYVQTADILFASPVVLTVSLPPGVNQIGMAAHTATPAGATIAVDQIFKVYCSPAGLPTEQPCCPPDENLQAMLQQIYNAVQAVYTLELQERLGSYAKATVHSGLTGSGSLAVSNRVGVLIDITAGTPTNPELPGNPPYEWNLGWISLLTADGMIDERRLTRTHRVWCPALMPLATTVGYFLNPGVTATITELANS